MNLGWASTIAVIVLLPLCLGDLVRVRARIDRRNTFHRQADQLVRSAPPHSMLFVRYPPTQSPHFAITRNEPDLAHARSWVVHDRGAENQRLEAVAPDRQPYLLDMGTLRLEPLGNRFEAAGTVAAFARCWTNRPGRTFRLTSWAGRSSATCR